MPRRGERVRQRRGMPSVSRWREAYYGADARGPMAPGTRSTLTPPIATERPN